MSYLKLERYKLLYARFLNPDRNKQLMDLAGNFKDKVFLDICCGEGLLTLEAIQRGAKFVLSVDSDAWMWGEELRKLDHICLHLSWTIEGVLRRLKEWTQDKEHPMKDKMIDIAICQQGINYWLIEKAPKKLWENMTPGGVFIFNTFNQEPSEIPEVRSYFIGEKNYIEITWKAPNEYNDVQHVQICGGHPPHTTEFRWMSDKYIRCCLQKYFDIELIKDGKTSIYKCTRKDYSGCPN